MKSVLRPYTKPQMRAIERLAEAIARCGKRGLHIYGVDDTVLAIRKEVLNGKPITEIDKDLQDCIATVFSGAPYIDSGGW